MTSSSNPNQPDPKSAEKRLRAQRSRQRIIAGARRHFFAHGFRSVTMGDLASELRISKKTLYTHFESKAALLETVLLEKLDEVDAELDRISANQSDDFTTHLQKLLASFQHQLNEVQPPFIRDLGRDKPELFQLAETRRRNFLHDHFTKVLQQGRESGLIRNDVPLPVIIEILLGAVQSVINPQTLEKLDLTPRDGFSLIAKIVFEGILTAKRKAQK